LYVVRTDKFGNIKWERNYGGSDWDFGNDLVLTNNGSVMICGYSYSGNYGKSDGYLLNIKLTNGDVIWEKYFGGPEDDDFRKILLTNDAKYSVAGNTKSYSDLNGDFWMLKVNNNGDSLYSKSFGAINKREQMFDFMEDENKNLVFCGSIDTSAANIGHNISYSVKTDSLGNFKLDFMTGGANTNDDKFLSVSNGNLYNLYFFSRKVFTTGALFSDIQPYSTTDSYIFFAAKTHGEEGEDLAHETAATSDNGFIMVGYTSRQNSKGFDIYVIKLNLQLDTAVEVVGISELAELDKKLFYFEDEIHFPNIENENYYYSFYDSFGLQLEEGFTISDKISTAHLPKNGLFIVRMKGSKTYQQKFIRN
jgi:hypothetical protein